MSDKHDAFQDVKDSQSAGTHGTQTEQNRRSDEDRRAPADRRRSARGLFELRARRDKVVEDRRQVQRRANQRFRLFFWRNTGT